MDLKDGHRTSGLLTRIWANEIRRMLTEKLWLETSGLYRCPDTRSRWRKMRDWIYWHTIGRFKAWLHRDCGDY